MVAVTRWIRPGAPPLVLALGPENFADFLAGFNVMDRHFAEAPAEENVPLLMGLLNVLYGNFFKAKTHAVLPYSQYLHRFPAYLQQLTMESNGKRVRWDGTDAVTETGEVFWGEPGTNGQHAFYQLIHQGTQLIPADFIAFANPQYALADGDVDQHQLFLGNFFAQTKALALGKTADEVRAEGTREEIVTARVFPGNKPTTSIMAPALTPNVLGQLIALYEHIARQRAPPRVWNCASRWRTSPDQPSLVTRKRSPRRIRPPRRLSPTTARIGRSPCCE